MGDRYYVEQQTVHVPGLGNVEGVNMVMMRAGGTVTKIVAGRSSERAKTICAALNAAYDAGLADGLANTSREAR